MTRRELIVKSLKALTPDNYFAVKTFSDLTQVRQQSKLLGIEVKSRAMGGVYAITLKKKKLNVADYELKPVGISASQEQGIPMQNLANARYERAMKHWETRLTPVGTSGITLTGLAYYPDGWQDIPEDWLIYEEMLDIVFKPRYVKNPALLTNKLTKGLSLPDTKVMLKADFTPCEAADAEEREQLLDREWK